MEFFSRSPSTIIIPVDSIENWREQFLQRLRDKTKLSLVRQTGSSTSKDLYIDRNRKEAFLVIIDLSSPNHKRQVQSQIEFYERYSRDRVFTSVVVPMTSKLVMKYRDREENVGMSQDYYGTDLREFRNKRGKISDDQIEEFVNNYQRLIDHTGYSHGDLFLSMGVAPVVQWEHIRMGNKGLKLIDYNGQGGNITVGPERYSPMDPDYSTIRNQEPNALRVALKHFVNR
ncbi:hypothetical protein HZA76_04255 [Candidatus Roizmanbacteria bacterium]|nr:hypothetical protein [Candidatus Roizmanbacteria bacterium]